VQLLHHGQLLVFGCSAVGNASAHNAKGHARTAWYTETVWASVRFNGLRLAAAVVNAALVGTKMTPGN